MLLASVATLVVLRVVVGCVVVKVCGDPCAFYKPVVGCLDVVDESLPKLRFSNGCVVNALYGGAVVVLDGVECVDNRFAIGFDPNVAIGDANGMQDGPELGSVCTLGGAVEH